MNRMAVPVLVLSSFLLGVPALQAAQDPKIESIALEEGENGGYHLILKANASLGPSNCRLRTMDAARDLILSMTGVESELEPAYEFPGLLPGPIRVIRLISPTGSSLNIEIPFQGMSLEGWSNGPEGLEVFLRRGPGPTGSVATDPYRLGPLDRLSLAVYGHEDLEQELEVMADGTVTFPLIGVQKAAGKSAGELRNEVEQALGAFLVDPQVKLDVKEYRSQPVSVVGEVETPGKYFLHGPTTLVDIIAQAGWMTSNAGSDIILTRPSSSRATEGRGRSRIVKKEDLMGSEEGKIPMVEAGDVITVKPKQFFYIRGEVGQPGQYTLEHQATIMKAISIAQGLTPYAKKKKIELLRTVNGVQTKQIVDLKAIEEQKKEDVPLLPDDVIVVPRRLF